MTCTAPFKADEIRSARGSFSGAPSGVTIVFWKVTIFHAPPSFWITSVGAPGSAEASPAVSFSSKPGGIQRGYLELRTESSGRCSYSCCLDKLYRKCSMAALNAVLPVKVPAQNVDEIGIGGKLGRPRGAVANLPSLFQSCN